MMAVRIVSSYEELEKFNLFVNIGVMMVIMNVMIMVVVRMITVMIFSSYEDFEKVNLCVNIGVMMIMVVVVMMMMVIDCSDGDTGPVGDVEVGQDVRHLEESNDLYQIFLMKTVLYAHLDLFDLQPSARQQDRVSKAWVSCDELVAEAVL